MSDNISSSSLLEKLDQQHHLLNPSEAEDADDTREILQMVRDRFAEIIAEHGDVESSDELNALCRKLSEALPLLFKRTAHQRLGHKVNEQLQDTLEKAINKARRSVRRELEKITGWKTGREEQASEAVNSMRASLNELLGLDLAPRQKEKKGLSEAEKNAYRHLASLVNPALLRNLLAILHKDLFQELFEDEDDASLKNYLGTTEHLTEPLFSDLPPEIFINPKVSWFRKILFNSMRDKYLPIFNSPKDGLKKVRQSIAADIELVNAHQEQQLAGVEDEGSRKKIMQENAWRRRFLKAVLQYFEDIENLPHPSRLKNSLGGREPFPSRHQQIAMFETAMLGNFFNGGEMGAGKTGAAIATFEYLREQRDEKNRPLAKKAIVLCPAGIVKVWKERLCNSDNGYFRHDQTPKVAVINGTPDERSEQWKEAAKAEYVVIGIEMSKGSTDAISHEEWINKLGADFLIIDEVHNVRRASKKETTDTQRIYRISQNKSMRRRVLLSGTPVPNSRKDIAAQIRLLNATPDVRDASHPIDLFQDYLRNAPVSEEDALLLAELDAEAADETQEVGTIDFHRLDHIVHMINRKDISITQQFLLPYLYRPKTQDCLPVGTKLHPVVEDIYDLTPREQLTYDQVLDLKLPAMSKMQLLHRVCLHANAVKGAAHTGDAKYARLQHWIDSFLKQKNHSGKIVVASPHFVEGVTQGNDETMLLAKLKEHYERQGIKVFMLDGPTGGHKEYKTQTDEDGSALSRTKKILAEFRDCKEPAILLAQMDTIREGIDLSFASRGILLSPAWTRSEEEQFWRRMYRRGQEHDVRCVKLISRGTIEEGVNNRSLRKQEMGEKLLTGLQLTAEEMALFEQPDLESLNLNKQTPRQQLNILWGKMMQKGKNFVQGFVQAYGKEIANLYNHEWETSHNGNTARLVSGIILQLAERYPRGKVSVADIASGSFALARTLKGKERFDVWSSDINAAMLDEELGTALLGEDYSKKKAHVTPMDRLPYEDSSKDVAVLSMALHYAMHKGKPAKPGRERVRTITEMHRVLKKDGNAVLTFPREAFRQKGKLEEFCSAMKYFGFEMVDMYTGIAEAKAQDDQSDDFEVAIVTLRKVRDVIFDPNALWENLPKEVRDGLCFTFKGTSVGKKPKEGRKPSSPFPKEGSYHEAFTITADDAVKSDVSFAPSKEQRQAQKQLRESKRLLQESPRLIQVLLQHYRNVQEIPDNAWVQVPLDVIATSPQQIKDAYANALMAHFGSGIDDTVLKNLQEDDGQTSLRIIENGDGRHLAFCDRSGRTQPKGKTYPLPVRSSGRKREYAKT